MTAKSKNHKKPCSFYNAIERQYAAAIYEKVYKLLNDPIRSREVLMKIIEETCERFTTCPPPDELRIYLFTLAYNKGMEYQRNMLWCSKGA